MNYGRIRAAVENNTSGARVNRRAVFPTYNGFMPTSLKNKSHSPARRGADPEATSRNSSSSQRSLWMLALIVIGTAVGIGIGIAWTPLEPLPGPSQPESSVAMPSPAVEVEFPAEDKIVTVESLQKELEFLADRLQVEFRNRADALHVAAMIHAELKQTQKAEQAWRACVAQDPPEPGPYVGLATMLMERGEDAHGVALLKKTLENGRESPELYRELVSGLMKQGEWEQADASLAQGLKLYPSDGGIWLQRGLLDTQQRRFDSAAAAFEKAIALGERSQAAINALRVALVRTGKAEQAKALAESATKSPNDTTSFQDEYLERLRELAGRLLTMSASVAGQAGKPNLSETWLKRKMALLPNDLTTYMELSALYRSSLRLREALQVHRRLLALQPKNILNHLNLASVASHLGDLDQAEHVLQEAAELEPDRALVWGELAKLDLARGRDERGRDHALRAQKLEPSNIEWPIMAAMAAHRMGDVPLVAESLRRAREIAPEDPRLKAVTDAIQPSRP
jgi:tetratricopeptide (TPR) repeat protein